MDISISLVKQKIKAASLHLIASIVVIVSACVFVLTVWYPSPFFEVSGLDEILMILLSVDLILGPSLTFLVFKPLKPSLKLDLSVIAAVQIVALAYGLHTVYEGHPLYVAYAIDRFELVSVMDAKPEQARHKAFQVSRLSGPTLVYAKRPEDPEARSKLLMGVLFEGEPDLERRSEYYEPFDEYAEQALARGQNPEALFRTEADQRRLARFLEEFGQTAKDYAFLPLSGKGKDVIWAFNRATRQPVAVIDINPWPSTQVSAADTPA